MDLQHIVNHAAHQPLPVHFLLSTKRELIQSEIRTQVAKHGLDRPDSLAVDVPPQLIRLKSALPALFSCFGVGFLASDTQAAVEARVTAWLRPTKCPCE